MVLDDMSTNEDLDKIATTVFQNAMSDPEMKFANIESVILTYGAKSLTVWVDSTDKLLTTKIENLDEGARKPHETTVLYKAAKQFMQHAVDKYGTKYLYRLVTKNPKMREWARGAGAEIFHWERVDEVLNVNTLYSGFETHFFPKNYEPDY